MPWQALVPSAFRPQGNKKSAKGARAKEASGSGTRSVLEMRPEGGRSPLPIVPAPKQPNSRGENGTVKEGKTPEGWKQRPAKNRQNNKDALDEEA
ncbi:MAG: hypothetical protein ACREDA_06300 [Methylocella sp.]